VPLSGPSDAAYEESAKRKTAMKRIEIYDAARASGSSNRRKCFVGRLTVANVSFCKKRFGGDL